MIGIVVPAHNEEALIGACLASLIACASDPALGGEEVRISVVLDRCTDRTREIACALGTACIGLAAGNVGVARARGFDAAIGLGCRWIASTDADTEVPGNWLSAQLAHDCDAFCGVVRVRDWSEYSPAVRDAFASSQHYVDEHHHVHGANFGVSAASYLLAGGFQPLPAHEDVALLSALDGIGAKIARKADPAVWTSARHNARARGGFSDYLRALEDRLTAAAASVISDEPHLPGAANGI